jgi:hypothetical protein
MVWLKTLGSQRWEILPEQVRKPSPTSQESGATRVALSSNGLNKGGTDVRRAILLVAMMALTLLVASGVALAVNKIGTDGPDTLRGINGSDNLMGLDGNDVLFALGGNDNLLGGEGKDWVLGGNDRRPSGGDKTLAGCRPCREAHHRPAALTRAAGGNKGGGEETPQA